MEATNPTFTVEQLAIWVTVAASITATLAVFGRGIKDWFATRYQKMHNKETVSVELKKVQVTEKEAQTHEIAVILEGFTAVTAASTLRAENAEKSAALAHERVEKVEARAEKVESRLSKVERIKDEMIDHIKVLEQMVPNPPGPPTRPTSWNL